MQEGTLSLMQMAKVTTPRRLGHRLPFPATPPH